MKRYAAMLIVIAGVGYLGSLAFANPAMLPKHPGYPASSETDPVTGQALVNDPGQLSLTVEQSSLEAASSEMRMWPSAFAGCKMNASLSDLEPAYFQRCKGQTLLLNPR